MYREDEYSKVFQWLSNGEKIQVDISDWTTCSTEGVLRHILNGVQPESFRLASRTIIVNGVQVPAPEREALEEGSEYFNPNVFMGEMFSVEEWIGSASNFRELERGLVYLNKEDAIARAKAMLITKEV